MHPDSQTPNAELIIKKAKLSASLVKEGVSEASAIKLADKLPQIADLGDEYQPAEIIEDVQATLGWIQLGKTDAERAVKVLEGYQTWKDAGGRNWRGDTKVYAFVAQSIDIETAINYLISTSARIGLDACTVDVATIIERIRKILPEDMI